jgi:predicted transcriptional regulator
MEDKEKAEIQRVVELLEENGYHVFKAEEAPSDIFTANINRKGVIHLTITPKKNKEETV